MPTNDPNNAPDDALPAKARQEDSAAKQVHDVDAGMPPGGGGLGGRSSTEPVRAPGGSAPNAPGGARRADPAVAGAASRSGKTAQEARDEAADKTPHDRHPSSQ